MLKKGFLGLVSDWVAEQTDRDKKALEKASNAFGLYGFLEKAEEPEKIIGLFSEWLVFDRKQSIFNNQTGLEYFTNQNPLKLPDEEIRAYKDLLDFEVGLFEVKETEIGRGIYLLSIANGNKNFVHDISASLSVRPGDTVWTRIAPVTGLYHAVGSSFFIMPIKIMSGMREAMSEWKKNSFDAKEVASWLLKSKSQEADIRTSVTLDYAKTKQNFAVALKHCGMENFFTLETYQNWATDEKHYKPTFAVRALTSLLPETATDKDMNDLIRTASEFANNIPRKSLKGKTSNEAMLNRADDHLRQWEMDIYSKEKYIKDLELANEYMAKGEFKVSFQTFERVIKNLLKDRVPFFHSFRICANAAICCFHWGGGREFLGEELFNAALRINPEYDFALDVRSKYVGQLNDYTTLSKTDAKRFAAYRKMEIERGKDKYRRTVFSKYEKFLSDIRVSLRYKTKTNPTIYSYGKDGIPGGKIIKLGRNDPCYCGSGKKYKKCCGQ